MEIIGAILVGLVVLGLLGLMVFVLLWGIGIFSSQYSAPDSRSATESNPVATMNEGDFHSGPEGYSPNTAYPDTFYGSGGSSDSGHDEGDFNR